MSRRRLCEISLVQDRIGRPKVSDNQAEKQFGLGVFLPCLHIFRKDGYRKLYVQQWYENHNTVVVFIPCLYILENIDTENFMYSDGMKTTTVLWFSYHACTS